MTRRRRLVMVGRGALLWVAILSLALGVGGWFAPPVVEAASLKSLQGTVTTGAGATPINVTLSPSVDATKAFVVCSARTSSANSNQRVTCVLTNTTLTIDGGTNSSTTVSVSWYVAEFEGGVSVQRGTATFNAGSTTPSAAPSLTAVDCTKSFVVLAGEQTNAANATNNDEQFTFRAILGTVATPCTSGTSSTLTLTRTATTNAATMAWQVVTYEGASVQRGVTTLLTGGATATATLGTAVDTSKSFILMSRQGGSAVAGVEAEYQVRAAFTTTGASVTGLTFTRVSTTTTTNHQVNLSWEVVALSDGSAVQTGTTTSSGTTATMATTGLTALDLTRTVTFFTTSGGSGTTTTHLDDTSWTVVLTTPSTSTITFTRGVSSAVASSAAWFTVSFNKCGTVSDATNIVANAQSGQATVYWDSAIALIARNTVDFAAGDVLVNGQPYAVSGTFGTSSPLPTVQSNPASAASSFNQSGLTNGTTYYYKVFKKTDSPGPCYAAGGLTTKTNVTPPDGTTLKYNWSYATGASTFALPGLTPNGVVIAGSNDNKIHGMSASTGTRSFTPYATGNAIQGRPPVIPATYSTLSLTVAYVTSQDGFVYAINTADGSLTWQSASLGTQLQGGAAVWLQAVKTLAWTIAPQPDMVVVGTRNSVSNNKVYGLHGEDGSTPWTFNPGNMDIIVSTPFIDYTHNMIWVTSLSNGGTQPSFWKLNAANGTLVAGGSLSLGDISSSPVASLDGNYIYVGTDAGELKAINAVGTPSVVATYTPPSGSGAVKGFPLALNFVNPSPSTPDTIIFSRNATVHSVSFNGSSFSTNWTTTNFPSAPVTSVTAPIDSLDGTKVYVGASDGKVHELSLSTGADGAQRGTPTTQNLGDPGLDIDLNRIYIGAADAHLYSFSTSPF